MTLAWEKRHLKWRGKKGIFIRLEMQGGRKRKCLPGPGSPVTGNNRVSFRSRAAQSPYQCPGVLISPEDTPWWGQGAKEVLR